MMLPEDWVQTAEGLLSKVPLTEADCRAAAHACYYAALHIAGPVLDVDVANTRGRHKEVEHRISLDAYRARLSPRVRELKKHYRFLSALRVKADYHLDDEVEPDEALQALRYMKNVLARPAL